MKKITKIITAIVAILLLFGGCKKDIRDKYIGDWEFETKKIYYGDLDGNGEMKRDTIYYVGKISLGGIENELIIQYTEKDTVSGFLRDDKIYTAFGSVLAKYPSGFFTGKNKIFLQMFFYNTGARIEEVINGMKKKGGKK